jgi:hypothetical protein
VQHNTVSLDSASFGWTTLELVEKVFHFNMSLDMGNVNGGGPVISGEGGIGTSFEQTSDDTNVAMSTRLKFKSTAKNHQYKITVIFNNYDNSSKQHDTN